MGSFVNFKKLAAAHFLLSFAFEMHTIVLGWQMYVLTRNPLYLGMIGLVGAVPALSLALFAGHIVDNGEPLVIYKRIITLFLFSAGTTYFSQSEMAKHILLMGLSGPVLCLFVAAFMVGISQAFFAPSLFVLTPTLVRREDLHKTSAWQATLMQGARVAGPALGGIVFGWLGIRGAAINIMGLLVMSLICVFLIPTPAEKKKESTHEPVGKSLFSGAKFVLKHKLLFPAMTLDMLSVMFGGVTALLPIYAAEILFIGPTGLGFLRAAPAIGAVLVGLCLSKINYKEKAGKYLFLAVAGFGMSILVFALSKNYILSFAALFLSGVFDNISMVIRIAVVQLSSPDSMRGRISSVNSIFTGASNELGEFESGVTAKLMGAVGSAVLGGIVCLITVVTLAALSRDLRKLNLSKLQKNE